MVTVTKDMIAGIVAKGASARVKKEVKPSFAIGEKILTKNINPSGHTRLPRYARGKVGVVHLDHGVFSTPDSMAHLKGEHPQHLYNIAFTARELWGEGASSRDKVYLDLWDDYLEKVDA